MPATDTPVLTVPQRTVVLSEEFKKSDQRLEALFEELKTVTGVLLDSVLEVYSGNLEMFRTFLESQKAEKNVKVVGKTWLLLADHYQKVLSRFHEFKTEADKLSGKGKIPPEVRRGREFTRLSCRRFHVSATRPADMSLSATLVTAGPPPRV